MDRALLSVGALDSASEPDEHQPNTSPEDPTPGDLGLLFDSEEQEDNFARPITRSQDSDLLLELGSDGRTPRLQDTIMADETADALLGTQSDGQGNIPAEDPTATTTNARNTPPRPPFAGPETQSTIVVQTAAAPVPIITSLKTLEPEEVISFLHSFDSAKDMCTRNNGQTMIIKAYMDGGVVRELSEAYRAVTPEEIRKVLDKIVEDYDANKQEDGFIILREQLKWPDNEPTLDRAVTKYFQDIRRVMSREDFTKNKHRLKQVVKEAIRHLPKFFNLSTSDYMSLGSLIEAGQRKFLPKEQFEAIKKQQTLKQEKGESDDLLTQLEQFLRMKAWANRDLKTSKQDIEAVMAVNTPAATPAPLFTPSNLPQQPTGAMTQQPVLATAALPTPARTSPSDPTQLQLLQAVNSLGSNLNTLLTNRQPPSRRRCWGCGDTSHGINQCPIFQQFLQQQGRPSPFTSRQQNSRPTVNANPPLPTSHLRPATSPMVPHHLPNPANFGPALAAQQSLRQPARDPNRAIDIKVSKFEGVNGQRLNVEQATIEIFTVEATWVPVKGCLDSGATVTVGSVQLHERYCFDSEFMRKRRDVVLPHGTRIPVTKQAKIWVRARHADGRVNLFPKLKIALVDSPEWEWLLIGWGDLYSANATPEQALYSNSLPASSLQQPPALPAAAAQQQLADIQHQQLIQQAEAQAAQLQAQFQALAAQSPPQEPQPATQPTTPPTPAATSPDPQPASPP